ncbi:hypothetical protein FMUND_7468 [Fusarium mundagurra]|uniref:Fucose-specific lectin n=1 Tax=Fusarium mundagurra TaxID=1567541 RepID=A0A8H6DF79_9HYPO|nr:hypothetical protein FMUND_7468 [Fusarium mundagurra]
MLFWANPVSNQVDELSWDGDTMTHRASPSVPIFNHGFGSITSASRGADTSNVQAQARELFYIQDDGHVGGLMYDPLMQVWEKKVYPFSGETARCDKVAAISAISPNFKVSLLCWIATDGAIRFATWHSTSNSWSKASYAAPPGSATIIQSNFIRATAVGPSSAHIFYLGTNSQLQGLYYDNITEAGSIYWNLNTISSHNSAAMPPGNAFLAPDRSWMGAQIFWSGVDGSVVEAHCDGQHVRNWELNFVSRIT